MNKREYFRQIISAKPRSRSRPAVKTVNGSSPLRRWHESSPSPTAPGSDRGTGSKLSRLNFDSCMIVQLK